MSSINAAAITAKHKGNAEGSVRVLGQTAAVAGISGALLLALKAMVLVAPAVLPGGDGLDALGRPNAVVAPEVPVVFTPAASDLPIGASERTAPSITRTVTIPTTTTKPVTTTNPSTPVTNNPSTPSTPVEAPRGTVGGVTAPLEDVLNDVVPGLGGTVGGVVDTVDKVTKPVVDTLKTVPIVGEVVEVADETLLGDGGAVADLTDTLGTTLGTVLGSTKSGSGGLGLGIGGL